MHYRITKKTLIATLFCSAAFTAPNAALAQQLVPEWTPFQDAPPADGDGDGYGSQDAAPARSGQDRPRIEFKPYIEAQQVLVADLKNGGDVLTYSTVAAGVDASVQTRGAEAQVNVRYERLIAYDNGVDDQDIFSGLARGSVVVSPGLSFEAGGIAARSKVDSRGPSPTNLVGNPDNVTQVYSVYAGPTVATQIGDLQVNAAYRVGYTKVEARDAGNLPAGQTPISSFDDSISHSANASIGMQPGALPIGWSVGVGYDREDADQLDQRYEGKYVRGDITVPITRSFAVVGGIGYEDIEVSERDAVRDAAGDPVLDTDGRLVTDSNSPRLTAYKEDGIIWDAGVMWRPSPRTSLSATVGQRYGSETYTGSFTYQPSKEFAVNVSAYDTVSGFGNFLNDNLASLPTQFRANRNPLSGDLGGCAFGETGGFCFNDALQTASNAAFRTRGVSAAISGKVNRWDTGVAVGYSRRKFLTSSVGAQAQLDGLVDQNYFAVAYLGTDIDRKSRFDTNAYFNYFDPGFVGASNVLAAGINAAYYRQIYRGLSATAAVGLDAYNQEDFDSELTGSALVGLRYSF